MHCQKLYINVMVLPVMRNAAIDPNGIKIHGQFRHST